MEQPRLCGHPGLRVIPPAPDCRCRCRRGGLCRPSRHPAHRHPGRDHRQDRHAAAGPQPGNARGARVLRRHAPEQGRKEPAPLGREGPPRRAGHAHPDQSRLAGRSGACPCGLTWQRLWAWPLRPEAGQRQQHMTSRKAAPMRHTPASKALAKYTVTDLPRARAGPRAVRELADWGPQVIKIEMPGSDDTPDFMDRHSPDFQNLHRNKRSMTLNLKSPEGLDIFKQLARHADVIVENYRPDVKRRLGIDYEAVSAINPRIVYASISGFGQTGPYSKRPGFDQIAQGMGGLMSITGLPGQGPVRVGIPIADLTAGIFLSQGILVALLEREVSGKGQWVHTSLLEAMVTMLDFQTTRWLMAGEIPPQAGNDHPTA